MDCRECGKWFHWASSRARFYCSRGCYADKRRKDRISRFGVDGKYCPKCKTAKSESDFYSAGSRLNKPRLSGWCRECRKENERLRRINPVSVAKHKKRYQGDMGYRAATLLKGIEKRARGEGIAFDLDADWLEERFRHGRCELTGLSFDMLIQGRTFGAYSPSVDRIVAGGGYIKANCRVIIGALNFALSNLGVDGFLPIAEAFVAAQRKRMAS